MALKTVITVGMTGLQLRNALNSNEVEDDARSFCTNDNTSLGYSSGRGFTNYHNTAIGYMSQNAMTGGYQNTSLGARALQTEIGGFDNVAIGYYAMQGAVGVNDNIGIGSGALQNIVTGRNSNTAIGSYSQNHTLDGNCNTSVGAGALHSNETYDNCAFGSTALYACATGARNCGFGADVLKNNYTGRGNCAYGTESMLNNTGGEYNLALGDISGYNAHGDRNVYIGYAAGFWEYGDSDRLFIDNRARLSIPDGRAKALIYGIFDDDVANQKLTINGRIISPQVPGDMTDDLPTAAQIIAVLGTAILATAGLRATIKDSTGAGKLYYVESDGTDWYYLTMTKAV